jgi:biopolymer transport protein ExbD
MAFHLGDGEEQGMNEINLIPLIDIMLVLMIIFLVTATVMNPAIPLSLPQTTASQIPQDPKVISISIDAKGQVFWDQQAVSLLELEQRMNQAATEQPKPAVHLRADKATAYDHVAQVMARAGDAGLSDLAFVNDHR